jgi:5-methylcytosine-specific restriction endonuclease McrA
MVSAYKNTEKGKAYFASYMTAYNVRVRANMLPEEKAVQAAYVREWWKSRTPEQKREQMDRDNKRKRDAPPDVKARRLKENLLWRSNNRELHRFLAKQWQHGNRHKAAQIASRHRNLKKSAFGSHSLSQIRDMLSAQEFRCATPWCQTDISDGRHTEDHKTPLTRGGSNEIDNMALLCHRCNCTKNTKTWSEWLAYGGALNVAA